MPVLLQFYDCICALSSHRPFGNTQMDCNLFMGQAYPVTKQQQVLCSFRQSFYQYTGPGLDIGGLDQVFSHFGVRLIIVNNRTGLSTPVLINLQIDGYAV